MTEVESDGPTLPDVLRRIGLHDHLCLIYETARPRCIGVLCRQRRHLSCNYFVPLARLQNFRGGRGRLLNYTPRSA
jgi:hypothetical protein